MALDLTALDGVVLPVLLQLHMPGRQIFFQRIGIGIEDEETSAKGGGHVLAEHPGVAARHVDAVFRIGQSAHEFIPIWDVLHLVEENHGLFAVKLQMGLQQLLEVLRLKFGQSFVLKIDEEDLVPSFSFCL